MGYSKRGVYHFQAGADQWWKISVSRNNHHHGNKDSSLIELYTLSWPKSYIGGRKADSAKEQA
jgi:hypothetical protein